MTTNANQIANLDNMTASQQRAALGGVGKTGLNWHVTRLGARESCGGTSDAVGSYPTALDDESDDDRSCVVAPGAWVEEWQRRMRTDFTPWTDPAVVAAVDAYFGDKPLPPEPPADAPTWGELGSEGYLPNVATHPEMPTVSVEPAKPRRRGGFVRPPIVSGEVV